MRILLVTAGYLPDGLGGVELSLHRFARWARDEGHEVLVFRRLGDERMEEFERRDAEVDGVPVVGINYRFSDATEFLALLHNARIAERFVEVLDEFRPDVVHVHHLTCLCTEIVDEARERNVPVVLSLHDYWMGCPRGQRIMADLSYCPTIEPERCTRCYRETWTHWFQGPRDLAAEQRTFGAYHARIREVLDRASALLVPSPFARDVYVRDGVAEERLQVLEYGMDVDAYAETAHRTDESRVRIGYLGSVLPSKGVHLLIDAFKRIGSSETSLEIHGPVLPFHQDHGYGERLQRLAEGWEAQIHFRGAYDPADTPALLSRLDVLVVPSIWYETYCMVIREGFLAGVPVLASNFGAMAQAIEDGETGMLFRVGDSVDLAQKLERLVRDRDLRERLAHSPKVVYGTAEHGRWTMGVYRRVRGEEPADA